MIDDLFQTILLVRDENLIICRYFCLHYISYFSSNFKV